MEIGKHIAKYRKKKGLKQEELAKRIGISPQAVSKWENGGAPDAALLPDIARELGVSIDSLFGIDVPMKNWRTYALEEFQRLEPEKQVKEICDFLWKVQKGIDKETSGFAKGLEYVDDEKEEIYDPKRLAHTAKISDGGMILGNALKSFHYVLVMPEPLRGFKSVLMNSEEYRTLFQTLARPGRIDILIWFYEQEPNRLIAFEAIIKNAKLPKEVVKEALSDLCRLKLIQMLEMEDEGKVRAIYYGNRGGSLLSALYFLREALQESSSTLMNINSRSKPLLD